MGIEISEHRFDERLVRQVRSDSQRALIRARFCPDGSEILGLRCVDDRHETERSFGSQLWYFEAVASDRQQGQHLVHGVIEYSMQYGLQELVDDGAFASEHQRDRFRSLYLQEFQEPSWRQPAHRWLAAGVMTVAAITFGLLLFKTLTV